MHTITITRGDSKQHFESTSAASTLAIAKKLGGTLRGGDIVALFGDLGVGKTVFAKGIASALGIKETVVSPTFVLMMRYRIPQKKEKKIHARFLYHIDTYRLVGTRAIVDAGIAEHIGAPDAITVIEWPDKLGQLLPKTTTYVSLAVPDGI
ncbi:tRNA (adenosine(37)-N6)-threonylcarbamoyltransferase complex ATPase subunit type 1 TsaE [Candidatus Uhrbacteria bacterium]|nr:tRNA (adenosine(37)-N6)-threonylcarbamoyltransferase complex ATPase subunit type 1 TsaE [Candidatus Uhrbacteria bacterium]